MATLGQTYPNLADVLKRQDPDSSIAAVIELLSEQNEILMDAIALEGNLPTGHRTTVRSGLPTVTWRKLNYGVQPSKSTTVQVTDAVGMLEAYAEVDKDLADLNGNTAEFRLSEDAAFIEAMNQEMATTLFYGDTDVDSEKFMGLTPRYDDAAAENGGQIIKGVGAGGDNTSMWIVSWDANATHLIYPKGSAGGLKHTDKGQVTLIDAADGKYEGYRSHYQWKVGLTVRDWRQNVRICNLDVSAIGTETLITNLITGINRVKNLKKGKIVIYCNRVVKTALDIEATNKTNVNLKLSEYGGEFITTFRGYPVRLCDAILETEALVA